jgi:hypothetical protein
MRDTPSGRQPPSSTAIDQPGHCRISMDAQSLLKAAFAQRSRAATITVTTMIEKGAATAAMRPSHKGFGEGWAGKA